MSENKVELPIAKLNSLFQSLSNWAVIRNKDVIKNFLNGGDCDIICGNLQDCGEKIVTHLGLPLRIAERSYVISYYYEWGHIDLTDHIYWRGLILARGDELLSRKGFFEDLPHVDHSYEAIVALLNSVLWGSFVKKRYSSMINEKFTYDQSDVRKLLHYMVGRKACRFLIDKSINRDWRGIEENVQRLRLWIRLHHFVRYPLRSLGGTMKFFISELKLRFYPQIPALILRGLGHLGREKIENQIFRSLDSYEFKVRIINLENSKSIFNKIKLIVQRIRNTSFMARNGLLIFLTSDRDIDFSFAGFHTLDVDRISGKKFAELALNAMRSSISIK